MTYDQTVSFIEKLADDIKRQADADLTRGRKKLASELYATANELYQARDRMDLAWKICEPYMKDWTQKNKLSLRLFFLQKKRITAIKRKIPCRNFPKLILRGHYASLRSAL